MNQLSDLELVERTRIAGDKRAFGLLLERYQAGALRMAQRMIAHEDTAREVVQEAMLQAYLSLNSLQNPARFQSWLYGIVINVCRSYLRRQRHDPFSIEALIGGLEATHILLVSHAPDPQTMVEMRELHELVLAAVTSLSPLNRQATLLYYYEHLSLREISLTLGISITAVKGRLHKSRRQLAAYFTELKEIEAWVAPSIPHSSSVNVQERKQTMIEVQLVDVILAEEAKKAETEQGNEEQRKEESKGWGTPGHYVLIFLDEAGQRLLPIWVGSFEGHSIAIHLLNNNPVPRPLTYDFMATLLQATGATLEEIQISSLHESTYYATALLRVGDTTHEIDARPSDAVALALRMKSKMYVAEEVLVQAGSVIPEQFRGQAPRKDLEQLAARIEEMKVEHEKTMAKFKEAREREQGQATNDARDRLFAHVFGK